MHDYVKNLAKVVRVADGYYLGRKYLKPDQQELLKRLSENLTGEDLATMNSIMSVWPLQCLLVIFQI